MDQNRSFVRQAMNITAASSNLLELDGLLKAMGHGSAQSRANMADMIVKLKAYLDSHTAYVSELSGKLDKISEKFNKELAPNLKKLEKLDLSNLDDKRSETINEIDDHLYEFKSAFEYLTDISDDVKDILHDTFQNLKDEEDWSNSEKKDKLFSKLDGMIDSLKHDLDYVLGK